MSKSNSTIYGRRWLIRRPDRSVVKDELGLPIYFKVKSAAKSYRDQVSQDYIVSPGPDHRKW